MAGLKATCADKLGTLEERMAGAVQAMSAIHAAEHKQNWASGVVHAFTPSFFVPRK